MEDPIQDHADSALEAEQTRETPRDEEPRKEKGEPTEQPIIHKLGRTGKIVGCLFYYMVFLYKGI